LTEIDEAEVLGTPKNIFIKTAFIISITIIFFITLAGFFIGTWLERKYLKKKRK
ncbi:unnamed protein product, partial [marine sediment metagenome]